MTFPVSSSILSTAHLQLFLQGKNWSNTFLNELYLKRFINLLVKNYWVKSGLSG